jgi:hypothetical protein
MTVIEIIGSGQMMSTQSSSIYSTMTIVAVSDDTSYCTFPITNVFTDLDQGYIFIEQDINESDQRPIDDAKSASYKLKPEWQWSTPFG